MPWEIQEQRRSVAVELLSAGDALALEAFRDVEFFRPGLQMALLLDSDASPQPAAIADITLVPIVPEPRAAERVGKRMQNGGWLTVPASRRIGVWFVSDRPPKARDLISATRRFQRLGGTIIGWAADDPVRNLPEARAVAPTVSASRFPKKF